MEKKQTEVSVTEPNDTNNSLEAESRSEGTGEGPRLPGQSEAVGGSATDTRNGQPLGPVGAVRRDPAAVPGGEQERGGYGVVEAATKDPESAKTQRVDQRS